MSGDIRGDIDILINPGYHWQNIQEQLVTLYRFLMKVANNGNGPLVLHASYFGNPANTAGFTDTATVGTLAGNNAHDPVDSSDTSIITTGFTDPPFPMPIQVVFSAGYDGGDLNIHGTDATGAPQSVGVLAPGVTPATVAIPGTWSSFTSIQNNTTGTTGTFTLQTISGMNYWDEAGAAAEGAFAVFRWKRAGESGTTTTRTHSWYFLLQWIRGRAGGAAPCGGNGYNPTAASAPMFFTGQNQLGAVYPPGPWNVLGFQTAVGDDGAGTDESPWLGSTNADGTDFKGTGVGSTPVWGATVLAVCPRPNGPSGAYTTNHECLATWDYRNESEYSGSAVPARAHWYVDDDNLVGFQDRSLNANFGRVFLGPYVPLTGVTAPVPHMMLVSPPGYPARCGSSGEFGGGTGGYGAPLQGAITGPLLSRGARTLYKANLYDTWLQVPHQPNAQTGSDQLSAFPFMVYGYEAGVPVINGLLGTFSPTLIQETSACNTFDQNSSHTRIIFGYDAAPYSYHYLTWWDGVTPVGTYGRAGVYFTATP